jgi:hypothetical protein
MEREFSFDLDQKVTTWMRTNFVIIAESEEEAKEKAINFYESGKTDNIGWDELDEVIKEPMSVDENGGESTAEIFTYPEGEKIYNN